MEDLRERRIDVLRRHQRYDLLREFQRDEHGNIVNILGEVTYPADRECTCGRVANVSLLSAEDDIGICNHCWGFKCSQPIPATPSVTYDQQAVSTLPPFPLDEAP